MQPTPLRGPKIVAFLKAGIGPTVFPIYTAARLMGKPLGRCHHYSTSKKPMSMPPQNAGHICSPARITNPASPYAYHV
jgi:hypothetical protein